MKTILITAIGGDIAQGVATILHEVKDEYRLIGVDIHEQHGGKLFVDKLFIVLPANHADYEDSILNIIESESVDIVMPMSECELEVWAYTSKNIDNVHWIMAGKKVVNTGLDKLKTIQALQRLGLHVPWTMPVSEGKPINMPCIMKDRVGSGSRNVFRITSEKDADYLASKFPDAIYQELLFPDDQEVTCAVYRTNDHRVSTFQMRRRLTGGLTGWIETINDKNVSEMCEVIAHGLELHGSMNIQLRITDQGPRVFEINPRFSSTALIRHKLGFCDVLWSLKELEGNVIDFPNNPIGQFAVRTHNAEILR